MTGQKMRIVNHLEQYGTITQHEALANYGVARLASRIDELRQAGYPIVTERVDGVNQFGEKCHWARYSLRKGDNVAQARRVQGVGGVSV